MFTQSSTAMEIKPPAVGDPGEMKVIPVSLNAIHKASQVRLYLPGDLKPKENRMSVLRSVQEVKRRFPDLLPLLDPIKDLKIKERAFDELIKNISKFEDRMKAHPLHNDPETPNLYELYKKKVEVLLGLVFNKFCDKLKDSN